MNEHEIVFTEVTGSRKTTAIAAVSEIAPLSTDVRNTDSGVSKRMTTVGLNYGELTLDNGDKLRLYGTPGQKRFDFMWTILSRGALGLVISIDNSQADPLADLDMYLAGFAQLIAETACVVAIGRTETHADPDMDQFATLPAAHEVFCPVLPCDVREPEQVIQLLELLLLQLEAKTQDESWS